jgi:hypothetical protein
MFAEMFSFSQRGAAPSQRRVGNTSRGKTFLAEEDIEVLSI